MRATPRSVRPRFDEDNLATRLLDMAYVARKMSPSWDRYGMSHDILGVDGTKLGRVLPGKGIYVDYDLSKFGIDRPIPGVFERSRLQRFLERLGDERGAITTYDGIINARANGKAEDIMIAKSSITTASGFWYDTMRAGGTPVAGSYLATTAPTDRVDDRTTTGAWSQWLTNPVNPDKKYLIAIGWGCTVSHNFAILADQLTSSGSFRTTVTSAETVAVPTAVTRQYGPSGNLGAGAQIGFTVVTARATPTATNLTVGYHDELNNSTSIAQAMPATADPVDRYLALPNVGSPFVSLASGDVGVRSLDSTTKAAAADAAGVVAGQILMPLAFVPGIAANTYIERDAPMNIDGLTELAANSFVIGCLKMLVFAGAASLGTLVASMRTCAG